MENVLPSKQILLQIQDSNYDVKFPNSGQFIDIQILKAKISEDRYAALIDSTDYHSGYSRLIIDMIATFNVLIPDLKKNLNVESFMGLSMIESRELVDVYVEQFKPWFDQWMNIITAVKTKEDKKQTVAA